jgi:hypothetical protein
MVPDRLFWANHFLVACIAAVFLTVGPVARPAGAVSVLDIPCVGSASSSGSAVMEIRLASIV